MIRVRRTLKKPSTRGEGARKRMTESKQMWFGFLILSFIASMFVISTNVFDSSSAVLHDYSYSISSSSSAALLYCIEAFLLPYASHKPTMKMLEIGLGCNLKYGHGPSVALRKEIFPRAEFWEANYAVDCVDAAKKTGHLDGINVLAGDQENLQTLDGWIDKSGGKFDTIIDHGGHHNFQIYNSFIKLWPEIVPGGLYFIEDLHTSLWETYRSKEINEVLMKDVLPEYSQQLVLGRTNWLRKDKNFKYKIPDDVQFIHCFYPKVCVIGKRFSGINDPWKDEK